VLLQLRKSGQRPLERPGALVSPADLSSFRACRLRFAGRYGSRSLQLPSGCRRMTIVVVHSLGGALVCLAGIGLWTLLRELLKPTPAPAAAVVQTSDVPVYLTGFGTVQAYNTVTVRARVDGALDKVVFVEGQDMKAGDLLAQIDSRPFQASSTRSSPPGA
jgi:hypothetical protein